ncbi:hypothetical protein B0T17DRAFT_591484 [Bombardia bombarda]|uniref:Zn(2)-C6 fungal-type domain-containing protein n=1 Tax=Bombardia bombarda TaxID=252184 RepID=A0AA40C1M1_9PEZI|nr:hypothetical protein B0T17DRAFT_591484 [Bombardia bombarda]
MASSSTEPERRHRRPVVSCSLCRRRKLRCNRETPCSNCVRSRTEACVYENSIHPPASRSPRQLALSTDGSTTTSISSAAALLVPSQPSTASSPTSQPPSASEIESMKSRIRQLEEKLSKTTPNSMFFSSAPSSSSDVEITASRLFGAFHFHRDSSSSQPQPITRSVTHKTRFYGQSHWINGVALLKDVSDMIEPQLRDETSVAYSHIYKCKSLAVLIKSRRTPPWPCPPSTHLPQKDVADELVERYIRTTESVYRILHIPTFKRDYEKLWTPDPPVDIALVIQLKLVMALGATAYDDHFSLRTSATRWIYEAQTWISEPEFKSRLGIQYLQTNILLLLAREALGVGGDSIWVSAGALFRTAVHMGLHRDPSRMPNRSAVAAEMRRRLWNTILEVALQSSLTSGGPPLLSLDDFDTECPRNFDDEQLVAENPIPRPEADYTQMSVAIALRKTYPIRLAIAKQLNDLNSYGTYEDTLRLDSELRIAYKSLRHTMQGYGSRQGPSPSQFEILAVDFLMHRYLSSLHIRFLGPALHETAYAFSRKVVVETSLKIWRAAYPTSLAMVAQTHGGTAPSPSDDHVFGRLVVCGSGFYRVVALQATLLIAIELKAQLQEDEGMGPVQLRPDLLCVLEESKTWCLQCLEAGETNIKGYLLMSVVAAHIDGLVRGLDREQLSICLLKSVEDTGTKCLPILEKMAAQYPADGPVDGLGNISLNEVTDDWDFMISDALFNPSNAMEPTSWIFDDDTAQGMSLW